MPSKNKKNYFADGELMEEIPQPVILESSLKSIDEVIGGRVKTNPFGTLDPEKYLEKLNSFSLIELQKECIRHGIRPKDRADFMIQKLMEAHKNFLIQCDANNMRPIQTPQLSPKGKKIIERRLR